MSVHPSPASKISRISPSSEDTEYHRLVSQLVATPAPRLSLVESTGSAKSALVQKVLEDPAVRGHYADRCVYISCDSETSTQAIVACLASALGLEPNDNMRVRTVLDHLATHGRTLLVLEKLDAIYSPANPEQQEAAYVLLATLAAVDELTLVVTLCGTLQSRNGLAPMTPPTTLATLNHKQCLLAILHTR